METIQKKNIIDKLIPDTNNILLDYVSFYKRDIVDLEYIYTLWKESLSISDVPVKLYLHIPFCSKICTYCMYNTILIEKQEEIEKYIQDVHEYISYFQDTFSDTVFHGFYVGGGTPSLLSVEQLENIFEKVFSGFEFDPAYHKTIELNPSSTTFEKLDVLKKLGFDRISFGVQSFHKPTLKKENRTYVSPERIGELVAYGKKLGFLDINTDIIVGMNDESEKEVLENLRHLKEIEPYTITVYTILKDMERSVFYKKDKEAFYTQIREVYDNVIQQSHIKESYNLDSWSNVLGFSLYHKDRPQEKKLYDAHTEEKESLFGIGFKSYSKIWGTGSYEMTQFAGGNFFHNFSKLTPELEMYSYVLQAFQFEIDKKDFQNLFGDNFDDRFKETLSYLMEEGVIENTESKIKYIGDEKRIGYYGMLFLDTKNLLRFIKYRFYEKK